MRIPATLYIGVREYPRDGLGAIGEVVPDMADVVEDMWGHSGLHMLPARVFRLRFDEAGRLLGADDATDDAVEALAEDCRLRDVTPPDWVLDYEPAPAIAAE